MKRLSKTPDDTFALGGEIGASLKPGDVVLLYGGLGAGKTLFTKGVLHALGYDVEEVTSPSFALVNLYNAPDFDVYHVDLWRIEAGVDPITSVGLDEIVEGGDTVTIVEWADRLGDKKLPGNMIRIRIEGEGDEPRKITVVNRGDHEIVIRKADRKLELYRGGELVRSTDVGLGPSPEGHKEREGDGRTPEGEYFVFAKNPKSRHHLSLAISYPDVAAVKHAFESGIIDENTKNQAIYDIQERNWIPQETPLGGRIYIHGGGCDSDWTDGCVAVENEEMSEIFEKVNVGTTVTILP